MNFIGRIIPVFIGWIIWRKTGHILIGALVAMFIETLTGPILNELQFLFVKKQNVQALNPFPSEQGKGMRVLIAKKRTLSRTPEQIVAEMKTELLQEENFNDLFTQVSAFLLFQFQDLRRGLSPPNHKLIHLCLLLHIP